MNAPVPLLNHPETYTYNVGALRDKMGGSLILVQVRDGATMTPTIVFTVDAAHKIGVALLAMTSAVAIEARGEDFHAITKIEHIFESFKLGEYSVRPILLQWPDPTDGEVTYCGKCHNPVDMHSTWTVDQATFILERTGKISSISINMVLPIAKRMAQCLIDTAENESRLVKLADA